MTTRTFFLKDIDSETFWKGLSLSEQASLDRYLHEMELGPADGEMDIDWQDQGQGYYIHLHKLYSIDDEQERLLYRQNLLEDINRWLAKEPNNYMVSNVQNLLKKPG